MHESRGDKIFNIANVIFMLILCVIMLYPIAFVVGRSMMSDAERAAKPLSIIPTDITMLSYRFIFMRGSYIVNSYIITVSRTVLGALSSLFFSSLGAYVLSRKEYPLRVPFTFIIVFTMWFSGGIVPTFLLIYSMGLTNSFWVYLLPSLISPWNMIIMRNFFSSLPESLFESARIDGANDLTIYARIVMPLSGATLATIGLFYAVWQWNAWFDALMYNSLRSLWPMQLFLREIIRNVQSMDMIDPSAVVIERPQTESVQMATIVVATVPILFVYPFLQKYFVKGVMVGSLKG